MATPRLSRPLAITQGDPAGIGLDILLAAWLARRDARLPPFIALADPDLLRERAALLGLDVPISICAVEGALPVFETALPVLAVEAGGRVKPGQPDIATATGTIRSIEQAVSLTREGRCSAVVTNPIAKSVLYAAGFSHPGHTEFLADLSDRHWGGTSKPVMLIWSETLSVVPVTIHIPLSQVPAALTCDLIMETARIVSRDWATRIGTHQPRIAMAGLNPHAGESGTIGREDEDVVRPAIEALRSEGIDIVGPLPADTMFHARARANYDVALCPYHDQALIPVKTLAFDDGVNVTLGLPFIRTSPDHGTAFDIAGKGIARPDSLIAAIRLAGRMVGRETSR